MTSRTKTLIAAAMAAGLLITGLLVLVTSGSRDRDSAIGDFPVTMVDDAGVTGTVASQPQRIVSLAPHITETLFALGVGDRIVGVAAGETHPPEATTLPRLVTEDGITPDPEAILQANPDLVLAATSGEWTERLRTGGLTVVTLMASDLQDTLKDMRSIGRLVGSSQAASELVSEIREAIRAVDSEPNQARPLVFVETFAEPLIAAAPESFVGSLVAASGGEPVTGAGPADPYPTVTIDQLRELDPDIYLAAASSAVSIERISARAGYSDLRAVSQGRVHLIADDLLLRPGPRLVQALETISRIIRETEPA